MVNFLASFYLLLFICFSACQSQIIKNKEARDDETEMLDAIEAQKKIKNTVVADLETTPVHAKASSDDAADDPAIWFNEQNPEESRIYGSNKKSGIHIYNLDGEELDYLKSGEINNIDTRNSVNWKNGKVDILAGSNRGKKRIDIYVLDSMGMITKKPQYKIATPGLKPYGFCLHKDSSGNLHALVNNKEGEVRQYRVWYDIDSLRVNHELYKSYKLGSQVEGMVCLDDQSKLFVGEEQRGIHVFSLKEQGGDQGKMIPNSSDNNLNIRFDIEGLALINDKYLVASSQGNFSYAVFDLDNENYVKSFKILDAHVDGVEETDGIEISTLSYGKAFPNGIFIAQDGFNYDDEAIQNQNFKLVDLKKIEDLIIAD